MAAKLHNISDMTKQFSFFYFNYSTFLSSALTPSNFSRCKGTTIPTPQFPKRHESSWTCELLRVIATYLVHRFPQIFLISKDIVIITDYFLARKSTAFSKTRLLAPHWYNHGTSWLRLAGASSRLSLLCGNEPCLYFSIAFKLIKPFPSRSQPCLFLKAVFIRA